MLSLAKSLVSAPRAGQRRRPPGAAERNLQDEYVAAAKATVTHLTDEPPSGFKLAEVRVFEPKTFRKELSAALRAIASDLDVAQAVCRIRAQRVPVAYQSQQFVDILTRACEGRIAVARKAAFSFAAALVSDGAFDPAACLRAVGIFFGDVYADLCCEVPRLPSIINTEFLPAMRVPFSQTLDALLPKGVA